MILCCICARGGSKGIPRKNLKELCGKPLIAWSIERALATPLLDRVVVSTDDEEIADVARHYGAEVPFIRPAHLAADGASKWETFRHLVDFLEERDSTKIDILVDLDTGSPLRTSGDIEGAVRQLQSGEASVIWSAAPAAHNPYFNMFERQPDGLYGIVKPPPRPFASRQEAPEVFEVATAVLAIKTEALSQVDHWAEATFDLYPIPPDRASDLDTPRDWTFLEFLMTQAQCETRSELPS